MSETLLRKFGDLEQSYLKEEKELLLLCIELAKEVYRLQLLVESIKNSPEMKAASIFVPICSHFDI